MFFFAKLQKEYLFKAHIVQNKWKKWKIVITRHTTYCSPEQLLAAAELVYLHLEIVNNFKSKPKCHLHEFLL